MSPATAIAAALALPLLATLLTALFSDRPNLREGSTLVNATALFAVVVSLLPQVTAGGRPALQLFDVLPGVPVAFEVEPLGMLFTLVASGLWIVTTCYSIGYMRGHGEEHQTRYYACFALAIFAAVGVAMAANLLTLFLFYEALTLSTYPLVTHHGTAEAKQGGRTYLGVLLFTSVAFLLAAVIWTWVIAGTLDFRPGGILAGKASHGTLLILLALFAFGTGKAALMPFHRWLPAAMVAPTPVSALLHAVAVVKAGVFTVLKIVTYIFGLELLRETGVSLWLMYVAAFTIIAASLVALTKDNLKARLAYSTISQLSYIVLGAALANSLGLIGGGMHIAMHAFGKITLFFCAGAIYVAAHETEISRMRGLGFRMPVTFGAFLVGALSVTGLPPMGGSWSKWFLALGSAQAGQLPLVAVLMISSLLNLAYLIPIPVRAFFPRPRANPGYDEDQNLDSGEGGHNERAIREAPLFCVVALSFTAAGCVALFFFPDWIYELLKPIAGP